MLIYLKSDVGSSEKTADVNNMNFPHLHLVMSSWISVFGATEESALMKLHVK